MVRQFRIAVQSTETDWKYTEKEEKMWNREKLLRNTCGMENEVRERKNRADIKSFLESIQRRVSVTYKMTFSTHATTNEKETQSGKISE